MVESMLRHYANVLVLRVRMPIVESLTYPRNFITKIIKYDKVRATTLQHSTLKSSHKGQRAGPSKLRGEVQHDLD